MPWLFLLLWKVMVSLTVSYVKGKWKYLFSIACEYFTFYKIYARFAKYSQERKLTAWKCSRKQWAEINLSAYCANHIAKLGWCEIMFSIYSTCVGKMLLDIWNIFTLGFEAYYYPRKYLLHQDSSSCFESAEWDSYQIEMFSRNLDINALSSVYFMSSNYGNLNLILRLPVFIP